MPLPIPQDGPQVFNNADSFAQAFDEAWELHDRCNPSHGLTGEEKLPLILEAVADHPFRQSEPDLSEQVAKFRLRLLGL
ncbi:MAG: hypothetical protein VKN17_05795 [Cyanobacteriota bacterium]|jgi:hypothetical protein|nr:hypothetical protein [Synechococcus sp. FGCU3]MEB3105277.1 hypothetical protein [Cyanobacteriota bacterium]